MTFVLDFADARPGAQAILDSGAFGVIRYICHDESEEHFKGKRITAAEISDYLYAHLALGVVFEDSAQRALQGYDVGKADGEFARGYARSLGLPDTLVIFYAIDSDLSYDQVRLYIQGVSEGDPFAGIYASSKILRNVSLAGWLTSAWSGEWVRQLQTDLNQKFGSGLAVDGSFGPLTRKAVKDNNYPYVTTYMPNAALFQDGNFASPIEGTDYNDVINAAVLLQPAGIPSSPTPQPVPPTQETDHYVTGLPLLRNGSNGQSVRNLQGLLNAVGNSLKIDGDFGPLTGAAVRNYQESARIGVDGIVGNQTWGSLLGATVQ